MRSQITRSDVRFELLLCTFRYRDLSPVESSVATISVTVAVRSVAVVSVVGISLGLRLGISRPLAVVVGIGVSGISVVQSRVGIRIASITVVAVEQSWVSLGLRLGISGPLSVVAINQPGVSLGLGLGLRLGKSESGPM